MTTPMEDILTLRREQVVQKWTEAVFSMYPFETTGFIRTQKDQFANPVGYTTRKASFLLYDAITGKDVDMEAVNEALGDLIRVRAVQDLNAGQAAGVLFLFKPILRELFLVDMLAAGKLDAFLEMESRLDSLALMAFTLYVAEREKVYATRVAAQRRENSQIARWAAKHGMAEK